MREIKFRAWVKPEDMFTWTKEKPAQGKMYTGFSFSDISNGHDEANTFCENAKWEEPKWDKAVIMQLTGLKDKNGVEIYEGDIYHMGDKNILYVVKWNDCGLQGKQVGSSSWAGLEYWHPNIEVIGNIYENPELLEATK